MKPINKIITGTYRIQLTPDFGFKKCVKIIPYLSKLGISHIYFSPYFQAEAGSTSGYDVVDNQQINEELGGENELQKLMQEMNPYLGAILDIVPNHISIKTDKNKLWIDVLRNGQKSIYAHFFDINYNPSQKKLAGKVLLPVLGDYYKNELENGSIQIVKVDDDYFIKYYEHNFPLNSASIEKIKKTGEDIASINKDLQTLDEIINMQFYFLAHWQTADKEINYRRFFSINHLIGLCIEQPDAFEYVHKNIFQMLENKQLDGLRIDHIDGLRSPADYLDKLRNKAPDTWIVVEKILGPAESIPQNWSIQGTTGYDFLNLVNGLFVNPAAKKPLSYLYRQITGENRRYKEMLYKKKLLLLEKNFAGETSRLLDILEQISMNHKDYRDLTLSEMKEGLSIIIGYFPVYRTYIKNFDEPISRQDKNYIEYAISTSKKKNPQVHPLVWNFFTDLLLAKLKGERELDFILRFQQLTGPLMAKGAEDTAFYCFNHLVSLNEVGGEPSRFGTSLKEFHNFCAKMQTDWPLTMLATSTHDTKRGEDVRMRINMLSEIPQQWENVVKQLFDMNKKYHSGNLPDANTEYLLYQTLVGTWPIEHRRLLEYMIKAAREEKVHTSWNKVEETYEQALTSFIQNILNDSEFIQSLETFTASILRPAMLSSLSQTLIKYTAVGIPDLYQGTELWDISLVDPDNRRPVDYELRENIFAQMEKMSAQQALEKLDSGLTKMYVIYQCLKIRRQYQECFAAHSNYIPLEFTGTMTKHIVGFVRSDKIITIAPRFLISLNNDWKNTAAALPSGRWKNIFTGRKFENLIEIMNLLGEFPIALLVKEN